MSKSVENKKLPIDPATWKKEARAENVEGKSIHTLETTHSGSDISWEQFLLLRTLWSEHYADKLYSKDWSDFIDEKMFRKAKDYLSSGNKFHWNEFIKSLAIPIKSLQKGGFAEPNLGAYAIARAFLAEAQSLTSEEHDNESPKVDMSPIANRTRNKLRQKANIQSSPTPASKVADVTMELGRMRIRDSSREPNASRREPSASRGSPRTPPTTRGRPSSPHPQALARGSSSAPQGPARSSSSGSSIPEQMASPFEDPRLFPAVKDEQIVNSALICLLMALSMNFTELQADWTLHRLPLVAKDHSQRNATAAQKKTYEARIDGYLKKRKGQNPLVIVEVKPFQRNRKPNAIRMQESAQMAAWINHYLPPMGQAPKESKDMTRLLISQDRHEIYLNFAVFSADYVQYICGSRPRVKRKKILPNSPYSDVILYLPITNPTDA